MDAQKRLAWNQQRQRHSRLSHRERRASGDGRPPSPRTSPIGSLYFNRELSWLDFNDRVLQLAEDPSVPLLERVKFCAIWESNLDEFYMVRVANLQDQVEAGVDARGADGLSASEQLRAIRETVVAQRERLERCFERELRPALAEHGIRHDLARGRRPGASARSSPSSSATRSSRR